MPPRAGSWMPPAPRTPPRSRQLVDRPEEATEHALRDDDQRNELQDLQFGPGEGRKEDTQRDRAQGQDEDQQVRDQRISGGSDAQSRYLQAGEDEGQDQRHL